LFESLKVPLNLDDIRLLI